MKRYIIISDGKIVMDSCAKGRAKFYAKELVEDSKGKAVVSVYEHVDTAYRPDIIWSKNPLGNGGTKPAKKVGKVKRGPRYTQSEDELLLKLLKLNPEARLTYLADIVMDQHKDRIRDCRTRTSVISRLGKLRRAQ